MTVSKCINIKMKSAEANVNTQLNMLDVHIRNFDWHNSSLIMFVRLSILTANTNTEVQWTLNKIIVHRTIQGALSLRKIRKKVYVQHHTICFNCNHSLLDGSLLYMLHMRIETRGFQLSKYIFFWPKYIKCLHGYLY